MSSSDLDASGSDAAGAGAGKLRLLCLHGFMQTGALFRSRIGSMRKALKSRAEFEFLDAPFQVADAVTPEQLAQFGGNGGGGLTWFKWRDAAPGKRPSQSTQYQDFEITYESMISGLRQHSPDGLLGFSQGATAAALLLAQLAERQAGGHDLDVRPPRFAILCAGFLPRDPAYSSLLERARVAVPTLFVLGDADALVPPERTLELVATFDPAAAQLLRHPGAHMLPTCSGAIKAAMAEFLDGFKGAAEAGGGGGEGTAAEAEAEASAAVGA
ncbi:hypothetical protein Rsub_00482 [Raphidocelis subcapitata]|uniref:Serine hydrolase domain-containing protein n=1 Tax=Raphidocelis subcapitata TaxID=307507 RepID=A0A2V0NKD6_9CHLO|nr:hypothetical protein Rsub_00482 [Raphidocelis subcapitata]|eukprot:GBF87771.1 hypothetical protein Rsub_00482 [Raphidocelis subcapitata]